MVVTVAAVYAGVAIVGGISKWMSGRKKKKWARRRAAAAAAKKAEAEKKMNDISGDIKKMVVDDLDRFDRIYRPAEERLAQQLHEGQDVEGQAARAGDDFTNQFDASVASGRRAMQRQGVAPGSSAMASFEEDIAFNRARGASDQMNKARSRADDTNFARNMAFSQTGQSIRQGITNMHMGQFGMAGQIRGQHAQEQRHQENMKQQASQQMTEGVTQAVSGAVGYYNDPNGMQFMTSSERDKFKQDQPALASENAYDRHLGR